MKRYFFPLLLTCLTSFAAQFPDTSTDGQVIVNSNNVSAGSSSLRWSFTNGRLTVGPTGNGSRVDVEGTTPAWRLYAGGNPASAFSRLEGFWDSASQSYYLREIVSTSNAIPFVVGINSGATMTFNTDGSATHSGGLGLSAQTNRLTISGGQLLLDGSPITGSSSTPSFTLLTQSGTNLASAIDFSSKASGSVWYITLTNTLFIGTPSNIPTNPFTWYLHVRQPSTGTCFVTFTNGTFGFPGGSTNAPIADTNNNHMDIWTFINSGFTNSQFMGVLTPDTRL